jgi:selenocysteine lyase/cysteine desulfurase
VDYLVSGAHKWMMGIEGSGFVYAKPERVRALVPRTAGWLSHEDPAKFLFQGPGELRYDRPIKSGIEFLENGSTSTVCFAALEAGLDPILALEPTAIFAHVSAYLDRLEAGLVSRGLRSLRRPEPERRSAILSFAPPAGLEARAIVSGLAERGVVASMPDGLVRFAPHFPNPLAEVDFVLGALDEVLAGLRAGGGAI